jgi:hypothetical protein
MSLVKVAECPRSDRIRHILPSAFKCCIPGIMNTMGKLTAECIAAGLLE